MSALTQQPVSIAIEADQSEFQVKMFLKNINQFGIDLIAYISSFQLYKSGVYTGKCGTNLDHGVLAVLIFKIHSAFIALYSAKSLNVSFVFPKVGYGVWEDGLPYWKVKNSWSSQWGKQYEEMIFYSDKLPDIHFN